MRENTLSAPTAPAAWLDRPAEQQPDWAGHTHFGAARDHLRRREPMVTLAEVDELHDALAAVSGGEAQVLQVGDCAEDIDRCTTDHAAEKLSLLTDLADELEDAGGLPVVRIGRIGGQFAKPRSKPTEVHEGVELPAFRGHLVNSAEPTTHGRRHDPRRMVMGYEAGSEVHGEVRRRLDDEGSTTEARRGPWSSHEALVLDYEDALLRWDDDSGRRFLASTHFPWIGERTRHPGQGHVALLASVCNPVGCKVGPTASTDDVLAVCEALDPERVPGRLTLISRMGRDEVARALPEVVEAVARAGHPVIWMCDPMHGNTVSQSGVKTRIVEDVVTEVLRFRTAVADAGAVPGGLHLEAGGSHLTECVGVDVAERDLHDCYESLCDPRLNLAQTREVLGAWSS